MSIRQYIPKQRALPEARWLRRSQGWARENAQEDADMKEDETRTGGAHSQEVMQVDVDKRGVKRDADETAKI